MKNKKTTAKSAILISFAGNSAVLQLPWPEPSICLHFGQNLDA
ncbi:hypothetical protein NC652_008597 [Populus alba x Populus x berolinensis]|nr:hypothetical protein NC652_008597 [Populus alba x Populus x berolinensis]